MEKSEIIVITHNIRSTHNVGSIFRTCDGFGIKKLYLTGYTPYPKMHNDVRLPHISEKLTQQISKTALGAEKTVHFSYQEDIQVIIKTLRDEGYSILGLEQNEKSILLPNYRPTDKVALILGEEVSGITDDIMKQCDELLEIPMQGKKESFNVSVAAGIALYALST